MKATFLLGTLKSSELSNTATLCEFIGGRMAKKNVQSETIRLVDHDIRPGTHSDMGDGDEWPAILEKVLASEIVIFATPVWWGSHSSETQKVIERLDELHDEILEGRTSKFDGIVGGIVVTGDSDGAQHIIGNLSNFFSAIGLLIPPFGTVSVLWERQAKDSDRSKSELLDYYEKEYAETADKMIDQLLKYAGSG